MAAPTITDVKVVTGGGTGLTLLGLTVGSGDAVVVGIKLSDGSPGGMTSVVSSGGGGAFSSISDSGVLESFLRSHVWRSLSPTSGVVNLTVTPAAATGEIGVMALSIAGVDAGTPNGSVVVSHGNGAADAVSGNVASDANAIVIDFISRFLPGAMSVEGGQTDLGQANEAGYFQVATSVSPGASVVTTEWGVNGQGTISNWQWIISALSINGAGAGGGPLLEVPAQRAAMMAILAH